MEKNIILKQIIGKIAFDSRVFLTDSLIKGEEEVSKENLLQLQSLTQIETMCSPYMDGEFNLEDLIKSVGIDNCCRFYDNLCSQYMRLQKDNWNPSALNQRYMLRVRSTLLNDMPLTTRSGDPAEYINWSCGDSNKAIEEFKNAASILNDTVINMEDTELPLYEGMDYQQIRKSLLHLINAGKTIIDNDKVEEIDADIEK